MLSSLNSFYKGHRSKRAQKRYSTFDIDTAHFPFAMVETLNGLFNGKCAYCESKINLSKNYNDFINRFRPTKNAKGLGNKETDLDHYWWLSYEWNNIYLCCPECNRFKSTWFPLDGKRSKPETNYNETIKQETNLIIDPCNDNIEQHLNYDFHTGTITPLSKKGQVTIQILNLNRKTLLYARNEALKAELDNWERSSKKELKHKNEQGTLSQNHWAELLNGSSKVEFAGARKAFILDKLKRPISTAKSKTLNLDTDNLIDTKNIIKQNFFRSKKSGSRIALKKTHKSAFENYSETNILTKIKVLLRHVYIEKIELKNYKCFDSLTIDLTKNTALKKEPWLVFLGENGVGKSSLIKAVALALMGQNYLDTLQLKPSTLLKYRKRSGYIKVYGSKKDELYEVTFNKNTVTSNIKEPPCYLLGYGSTRLLPKGNLAPEPDTGHIKTKNLFDYTVSLSDAKSWLLDVKPKLFNQVALSLKDLLLLDNDDLIKRSKAKNSIYIDYIKAKNKTDVEELSDGYKSIFAITVDIIKTLSKNNLAFETAEAIVLIDEIGTHLHPRWKMEVVNRLRKTFPKIQFIVTTHEPLCLRGLEENEVLVLKKNEDEKIIAINDLPSPSDFRVDQLLTSEYFGLNSTLDFDTETLFKEYYNLLAKDDKTPNEVNRISELNETLPNKKHIGDDIRDELVYYVIDELLAKQVKKEGFKMVNEDLKQDAVNRVKAVWEFIEKND